MATLKNNLKPSVYGIGFIGEGDYRPSINRKKTKAYSKWNNILHRSYDVKYKENNPTYKDVIVCKYWHNFQNFAKWFENNYKEGFELDKDILIKGNKIYSPETCCFVPREINSLFKTYSKKSELPIGVTYDKFNNKYKVSFRIDKKMTTMGRFDTISKAHEIFKITKEKYIREIAEKWKGIITEQVYEILINYKEV